nr:MAG TPA: hypothetical protein [Caudoviricetes sp.]
MANKAISTLPVGSIIKLNESGNPVEFYVCKHDYESELNGSGRTLVVRKDCYDTRRWHSSNVNAYASSAIDSWLNSTYKNLLDADIRGVIGTTKIKYTPGNGNNTVGTLQRAIFLLSATELNRSASWFNVEGTALEIASSLQIAYMNGSAVVQWTRSPNTDYTNYAVYLYTDGNVSYSYCTSTYGSRPAFTLPSTTLVDDSGNVVTVDLTAHKTLVNGTAYTVKGGKCMVNGTVYNIKKGRTLIGGTGYDINFEPDVSLTWYFNQTLSIPVSTTSTTFSTRAHYEGGSKTITGIQIINRGDNPNMSYLGSGFASTAWDQRRGWRDTAYRTITFDEAPSGDLLAWLQENATPQ